MAPAYGGEHAAAGTKEELQEMMMAGKFHPTLWGDFFLTYQPPYSPQQPQMEERAQVLKEQVRTMIKDSDEIPKILDLIITLQRLGLDCHYENEINHLLDIVFNSDYDDNDLHLVSLRFYLLRKNGYDVSPAIFLKFQEKKGNFGNTDIKGLLSLYNAAHVRNHGDKILDDAVSFTRRHLLGVFKHLESRLSKEVATALETPLFRKVGILEARNYIPCYENEATRNEAILELAKLNFNLLQLHFCEELKEVTLWWKELMDKSNLSFVRDRMVESYFWMNGACYQPQYSCSRVILAKITALITTIDDIFDAHATTEESMQLAEAIYRWDESAVSLLPAYMKGFYLYILETFSSFEDELGPDKSYRVLYLKEEMKNLVRAYTKELKWLDEKYVPKTMSKHLEVSGRSIGSFLLSCAAFAGMDDTITEETFKWISGEPELIKSLGAFVRLSNDIVSTKREETAGGVKSVSTVHCYMKEYETTMDDACEEMKELVEDSWKDMYKYSLEVKGQPLVVAKTVLNLARTVDHMYKRDDGFTTSGTIRDTIRLLFVESIRQ